MQVWPNHRSNLILMERYHFFTSSCVQFGVKAPSLAQMHRDESETEGCLATTLRTLRAIHYEYFNGHGAQVNSSSTVLPLGFCGFGISFRVASGF